MARHLNIEVDEEDGQRDVIRKTIARLMEVPTARKIAVGYLTLN